MGLSRNSKGQFLCGAHWRPHAAFRERDVLASLYVDQELSAAEIAAAYGVTENAILYWLTKHNIPRRNVSEVRARKYWGVSGPENPMFGRFGPLNPRWVDGSSPERQRVYASAEGKAFIRAVFARDGYRCVRCTAPKRGRRGLHAHHIRPWAGHPEGRLDIENAVTLCRLCHQWVHSKENANREYLA